MNWTTAPISPTCEVEPLDSPTIYCGEPTAWAYRVKTGGWFALCADHRCYGETAEPIAKLIASGETFECGPV